MDHTLNLYKKKQKTKHNLYTYNNIEKRENTKNSIREKFQENMTVILSM